MVKTLQSMTLYPPTKRTAKTRLSPGVYIGHFDNQPPTTFDVHFWSPKYQGVTSRVQGVAEAPPICTVANILEFIAQKDANLGHFNAIYPFSSEF